MKIGDNFQQFQLMFGVSGPCIVGQLVEVHEKKKSPKSCEHLENESEIISALRLLYSLLKTGPHSHAHRNNQNIKHNELGNHYLCIYYLSSIKYIT